MADDALDVHLGGTLAGRLHRADDGQVEFVYEPEYRFAEGSTRLSVSMPLDRAGHGPDVVMPWLANLLPDNDRVRARWAEHFGTHDTTAFGLLRHMGADCAGAVQVMAPGEDPSSPSALVAQSDEEIAVRIEALRRDDAAWNPDDDESFGRFSLGGAQGKFALGRVGGEWMLPTGRAASTHIFKVGVRAIPDSDLAELVTTRAAKRLGLPTADLEYARFGGQSAIQVRRFDRIASGDGTVRRLHQEDFCQALGVWPAARYEKEGAGPGLADLVRVIDAETTAGEDRAAARSELAVATAFHLLSIGTDAHAKNHGLLHIGERTRMAPLYDLGSAAFAFDGERLLTSAKLPLRYGTSFLLREIDATQLVRVADVLGIDRDEYLSLVRDMAVDIPDAFAEAVRDIPEPTRNPFFSAAPAVIAELSTRIIGSIDALRASSVASFAGQPNIVDAGRERRWSPGRPTSTGWSFGRYR